MKNQGIPDYEFNNKPVIGICNTWSELTPCNGHFRELAESVKRGVLEAGGFPVEFPVMQHTGKAMVFENLEDYKARIDNDNLAVDKHSILVLKNVGPKGYPGMPEVGNMGLPKKLLLKGISDMVCISDGRMSGTGFGTVVLHVSQKAAAGGAFSLVQTGDTITLDVPVRTLHLHVSEEELAKRKENCKPLPKVTERGYVSLYIDHVQQSHLGCDMDFLKGASGSEVTRDSH